MLNNSYDLSQRDDGDWSLGLLGLLGLIAIISALVSLGGCSTADYGEPGGPPVLVPPGTPAEDESSSGPPTDESSSGSEDESSSGSPEGEGHGTGGGSGSTGGDQGESSSGDPWECAPEAGGVMSSCTGHCPDGLECAPFSVCTTTCEHDDDCTLIVGDTPAVLSCLGGYCLAPCEAHSGQAECEGGWCLPGSRCTPATPDEGGPWACAYPPHD